MTHEQFKAAYRAFYRRRPFKAFLIEFISGSQLTVGHPEAIRDEVQLCVMRCPDGGSVVFAPESVARLLDFLMGKEATDA